jgi:hypothetical protein
VWLALTTITHPRTRSWAAYTSYFPKLSYTLISCFVFLVIVFQNLSIPSFHVTLFLATCPAPRILHHFPVLESTFYTHKIERDSKQHYWERGTILRLLCALWGNLLEKSTAQTANKLAAKLTASALQRLRISQMLSLAAAFRARSAEPNGRVSLWPNYTQRSPSREAYSCSANQ